MDIIKTVVLAVLLCGSVAVAGCNDTGDNRTGNSPSNIGGPGNPQGPSGPPTEQKKPVPVICRGKAGDGSQNRYDHGPPSAPRLGHSVTRTEGYVADLNGLCEENHPPN